MKTIVVASNNKHKIKEFKEILSGYQILSLEDVGYCDDIEENGNTFLHNALIKAKAITKFLQGKIKDFVVVADDSGLCVNALNGAPGVYSARYAGDHGNNGENRRKLLTNLAGKLDRSADFVCCLVAMNEDGTYHSVEGKTYGEIAQEEIGKTDFGYDCLFYSNDLRKTFGEATEDEKNSVSHRARAIKQLIEKGLLI